MMRRMTPDELDQVGDDAHLIARLRPWIDGIGIAAAVVAITVYRLLGEI